MTKKNDPSDNAPLSPEELQAIGEIELGPAKHEVFLNNHYKKILLAIIVLSIGSGIGIAIYSNDKDNNAQASHQIVAAMKADQLGKVAAVADFDTQALQIVETQYPGTASAPLAEMLEAMKQLQGEQSEIAIATLNQIAQNSPHLTLRSRAASYLASYYIEEGKDEQALALWKQITEMEENTYTALAFIMLGDHAKLAGDKDAALRHYSTAKQKCTTSTLVRNKDIEMRIMLLKIDAPEAKSTPLPTIPDALPSSGELPEFSLPSAL